MDRNIYRGNDLILVEKSMKPVCGEDFCDTCGDCLNCYGDDPCYHGDGFKAKHVWVFYQED